MGPEGIGDHVVTVAQELREDGDSALISVPLTEAVAHREPSIIGRKVHPRGRAILSVCSQLHSGTDVNTKTQSRIVNPSLLERGQSSKQMQV